MTESTPSRARSLRNLGLALLGAAVLLVLFVLPAEYGVDVTGLGGRVGLTALKRVAPAPAQTVTLQDGVGGNERLTTVAVGDGRDPTPLPNPAVHQAQAEAPRTDTMKIDLGADDKTEVKAQLAKGKMIVYSWQVEGGKVYVDFHGHDPSLGDKFWVRYEEADGITGRNGSLVAPFQGQHGWYWLNVSDKPVTITLTVTGYQDKLIDYGRLQ
jgi:hypothetical protein